MKLEDLFKVFEIKILHTTKYFISSSKRFDLVLVFKLFKLAYLFAKDTFKIYPRSKSTQSNSRTTNQSKVRGNSNSEKQTKIILKNAKKKHINKENIK